MFHHMALASEGDEGSQCAARAGRTHWRGKIVRYEALLLLLSVPIGRCLVFVGSAIPSLTSLHLLLSFERISSFLALHTNHLQTSSVELLRTTSTHYIPHTSRYISIIATFGSHYTRQDKTVNLVNTRPCVPRATTAKKMSGSSTMSPRRRSSYWKDK